MARKQQKPKSTWGGARANSGGPRQPGPGKFLGRPRKFGEAMIRRDVRVPPSWLPAIEAAGNGDFADGVRRILQESGRVGDAG